MKSVSAWVATHAPAGTRWGKRVLSLLLSLVLCLTLLPGAAFAAVDGYGFFINGTEVTAENIDSFTTTGSISYESSTRTLTLTNATIKGASDRTGKTVLDCRDAVQTIKLVDTNVIQCAAVTGLSDNEQDVAGIYTSDDLIIKGSSRSDSLEITMPALTRNIYTNMRGIKAESGKSLTIQSCTLDVVCAGETQSAPSVTNAIYAESGDITIENVSVNAVIGKDQSGNTTTLYGGTAIYADGGTLSIANSDVTAGAYSSRNFKTPGYVNKYTALEGKTIELTGCTLDLTGQGGTVAKAARALHTNKTDGSITLTNCTGTLTGSDYGIHIEPNKSTSNHSTLAIIGSDLTITGGKKAIYTTGPNPVFTCVAVKGGADADSAQDADPTTEYWVEPYLKTEISHNVTNHDCTDGDIECSVCHRVFTVRQTEHNWSGWTHLASAHTHHCQNLGCGVTETKDCSGGTATCRKQAVCEVCGEPYGALGGHDFTAETVGAQYWKSAATCTETAVYYTSCTVCGLSSKGTVLENTFGSGAVDASNHTGAPGDWQSDADKHWKVYACCGAVTEESAHVYADTSDADCDICGYIRSVYTVTAYGLYGERLGFTPGETYTQNYAAGERVGLPIGTRDGYTFSGLTCQEIEEKDLTITSDHGQPAVFFTMPENSVTLTAKWTPVPYYSPSYAVTVEKAEHGSVTVSPKSAAAGATVTVTVTPDEGYTLETLTVADRNGSKLPLTDKGGGKYTFPMPSGSVTVKATFMDDNTMLNFFVDVKPGDYFYDAVLWAAQKGITSGTDAVHFSPNQPCTRGQIVTFLWRATGSPVVNYAMDMTDVPEGSYYAEAVRWALSLGITTGTGADAFSPDAPCTRAQAVTFLARARNAKASGGMAVREFADFDRIPAYAVDAIQWALENGVTTGTSDTAFSPDEVCTRAQIVTFLYRALEK